MKWVLALLVFSVIAPLHAQEGLSSACLTEVDVVVVGTLHTDFKFPWIDGWNERGHIQVDRVVKGEIGAVRSLPFAWERDFRRGWCLTRPDWRGAVGKRGIWLLTRDGKRYRAKDLFVGYLDPDKYLDQIIRLLKETRK